MGHGWDTGGKGVGGGAGGTDMTPAEQDEELGYYQKKKLEEHKQRVAEQQKREQRTLEKLVRQKEQGTQLTVEAKEWMDKKIKENPAFAEKMDMRELAKKSLSSANWAGELMKGSSTKFASKGQVSVEDSLKHQTVGLVTYDDYKRKKQEIELQLGEGGGADGGGGGEGGGAVAGSKKRKVTKKCNLSFDADKDD